MDKEDKKAFDEKCYELAVYFLGDLVGPGNEAPAKALAQHIQESVEDWMMANQF
jgi:hypothetical protein